MCVVVWCGDLDTSGTDRMTKGSFAYLSVLTCVVGVHSNRIDNNLYADNQADIIEARPFTIDNP